MFTSLPINGPNGRRLSGCGRIVNECKHDPINMEAPLNRILTLNLIATTIVFYVAARIYLLPQLGRLRPRVVLIPILLLHSLRHLGLMFLTRGATYPGLPPQFAYPAALGDVLTAVLAFVAIF